MKTHRVGRLLAAAVAVPAVLVSTSAAALAATNTLTLTALNRSGAKVAISATVVNARGTAVYTIKSGSTKSLPKDTYVVLTEIDGGNTSTLAGTTVKVSGATKLTVDARKGHLVRMGLYPAPIGLSASLSARVCSMTGASYNVENGYGPIYVIPTTSKLVGFAALGSWTDPTGGPDSYAVTMTTSGVPSTIDPVYRRTSLGTILADTRRGPGGTNSSDVAVQPAVDGCGLDLYADMATIDKPAVSRIHVSPSTWVVRSDEDATDKKTGNSLDIGGYMLTRKVTTGSSSGVRFYGSAWGPGPILPYLSSGTITYNLNDGFEDPLYATGGWSVEGGDKATGTLTFGGKTVKTTKDTGWMPSATTLSYTVKKSGWYTLSNVATRYYPEIVYPSSMLSTESIATFHFPAQTRSSVLAPVYAVQMLPNVSEYNQAKPTSTTNVTLKIGRSSWSGLSAGKNPTIKSVTAQMSTDGKTWKAVTVKKINGVWTAQVANPAAGLVSLRVRETNTTGSYTEVTIYRAYGIGVQ